VEQKDLMVMPEIDKQYMGRVSQQMNSAARDLRIALPAGIPIPGMVYASSFYLSGNVVAAALIADIEKVTLQNLNKGEVVGIVYLQFPSIPVGFYKLQIVKTKAQFINKAGKIVVEMPVTVTAPKTNGLVVTDATVDVLHQSAHVSGHWGHINFDVVITYKK
jgi:hypothetical protein